MHVIAPPPPPPPKKKKKKKGSPYLSKRVSDIATSKFSEIKVLLFDLAIYPGNENVKLLFCWKVFIY